MHRRWTTLLGFWLAALCLQLPQVRGDITPHPLISDGMVLQRDTKAPIWGTAMPDEKVTVQFQGKETSAAVKDGKWLVRLEGLKAGGPYPMIISGNNTIKIPNVYVGEVWICSGQSNMEWPVRLSADPEKTIANSDNPMLRLFTVPHKVSAEPQKSVQGSWTACGPETVPNFSAVAYFFGRDLQKKLGVPVGLIHTSWGGTPAEAWTSLPVLEADPNLNVILEQYKTNVASFPKAQAKYKQDMEEYKEVAAKAKADGKKAPQAPRAPVNPEVGSHRPAGLYNGMIAPLQPYAFRGAIWYQGESNASRAHQYRTLFPAMITNWRKAWNQGDFPFLFVQLAPFMKKQTEPSDSAWAELREAQLLTSLNLPRTAQAVITDVGDEGDIHPKWKEPVGARLALAARALAHGEKIVYSGPLYSSMKVEGGKAVLSFKHVGSGLVAKGGPLEGFTIAGEDKKFYKAEAAIEENKVVVWSPMVEKPVAVRFGWANFPVVNLWNKEGLPASPFRTDDFPMVTAPKKVTLTSEAK